MEQNQAAGIILSAEAVLAAKRYQTEQPEYRDLPLRIYLSGKGCDGFDYGVSFDPAEPGDLHFPQADLDVVCDSATYGYIAGSTVEWVDDERGKGFLVQNPKHRKFRGKFYRKKNWQDKLAPTPESEIPNQ